MANTPNIQGSEGAISITSGITTTLRASEGVLQAVTKNSAGLIRGSEGFVTSVINFPTAFIQASEGFTTVPARMSNTMLMSQGFVNVVANGRIANFHLRAWTFTIDGHDFYVLNLGDQGTLVYDVTTAQWMTWESAVRDIPNWRAQTGCNWNNALDNFYGSEVVAGDDTTGMLWVVDPDQGFDGDGTDLTNTVIDRYERVLTGGLPMRGRGNTKSNLVFLTASLGNPVSGSQVLLRTSDDLGKTWTDNGYITVNPNEWDQDIAWYSLGSFGAPGRIFEVVDDGAFERIDSLDMK